MRRMAFAAPATFRIGAVASTPNASANRVFAAAKPNAEQDASGSPFRKPDAGSL